LTKCFAELKQDQELAKERTSAGELHQNDSAAVAAADDVAMTTLEKLEETCELFFKQLKEARMSVGRPEDLRVSHQHLLL